MANELRALATQTDTTSRNYSVQDLPGENLEDAVLDSLELQTNRSMASSREASLIFEVAPDEFIRQWLGRCRVQFVREMAHGLVKSAIYSYDTRDLESLGQAVVDWTSTLELEADIKSVRRLQRRIRRGQHGNRTTIHGRS